MKPKAPKKKDIKPSAKSGKVRELNPIIRPKHAKHKDWKDYTVQEFNDSDDLIQNWIKYNFVKEMWEMEETINNSDKDK